MCVYEDKGFVKRSEGRKLCKTHSVFQKYRKIPWNVDRTSGVEIVHRAILAYIRSIHSTTRLEVLARRKAELPVSVSLVNEISIGKKLEMTET